MMLNNRIRLGMTREEVFAILGQPTAWQIKSRKQKLPTVYKFGDDIEYHFDRFDWGGKLWLVYTEEAGQPITLLKAPLIHNEYGNAESKIILTPRNDCDSIAD